MTTWIRLAALLCACALALPLRADLASIKTERKPEKRAEKALDNAQDAFKHAQNAYMQKGDLSQTATYLDELMESVQLAYDSLIETGKNPSKSPKHFKNAEIKTRELLRRLKDFQNEMGADDRKNIEQVRDTVRRIHEDLLLGIMGSKESKLRTKR